MPQCVIASMKQAPLPILEYITSVNKLRVECHEKRRRDLGPI